MKREFYMEEEEEEEGEVEGYHVIPENSQPGGGTSDRTC